MADHNSAAEQEHTLTRRDGESQTAFTIRCIKAEVWDEGYEAGLDHETHRARDREWPVTTPNPYRDFSPDTHRRGEPS